MSSTCERTVRHIANALDTGLPSETKAHCETCSLCAQRVREAHALRGSFARLRVSGDEAVRDIDLRGALLEAIEQQNEPLRWRRFAAFATAACAVLAFWLWPGNTTPAFTLDAPGGATIASAGQERLVSGSNHSLQLPVVLTTKGLQQATLRAGTSTALIASNSQVSLRHSGELYLEYGLIDVTTRSELPLSPIRFTDQALPTLTLRGHAAIERRLGTTPMKLLKRHRILAASAIATVVLYSGYATITGNDSDEVITAPAVVYVDESGKTHRLDPDSERAAAALNAASNAKGAGKAGSEADQAFEPSGAYWSEADQVVQFRIRGEAFDADTGHPIEGFELSATLLASGDFAQRAPVTHSFDNLDEGRFLVTGLGVGTWRINAAREGYAPVLQTLEIANLQATPYLVIPLSADGAQVSGRVIDWQGRAVGDAQIGLASCLQGTSADTPKAGCNLVTSDSNGRFVLDKLPSEEVYSLYAKHERYGVATSSNLQSPSDEDGAGQHITIRLSGVVRIYGRVMRGEEKTPVESAVVQSAGGVAHTSASGDYEFLVPLEEQPEAYIASYPGSPANLAIHSYPLDRSVRPLEWVDAQDHAAQLRIDFFIEMSDASLVGTIRDDKDRPMEGLEVQLLNTNGWKRARQHQTFPTKATTDAQGNYRVDNIPEEAGYMVRYRTGEKASWNDLGYVNISEEGETRADFQIGSASIRGRFVTSESGAPMSVSHMSCSRLGAERSGAKGVFALAHCYPDGRFEFNGLVPGNYELHSKTEWMDATETFEATTVTIAAGQVLTDVEVPVEGEGATLWKFRILSKDNEILTGAYIRYQVGDSTTAANLITREDGTSEQQLSDSIEELFLEVPGYQPAPVHLSKHKSSEVLEVRLEKRSESEQ